jgi:hypothetical protein
MVKIRLKKLAHTPNTLLTLDEFIDFVYSAYSVEEHSIALVDIVNYKTLLKQELHLSMFDGEQACFPFKLIYKSKYNGVITLYVLNGVRIIFEEDGTVRSGSTIGDLAKLVNHSFFPLKL